MPEIAETTIFRFDELADDAKEEARSWYRRGGLDYDWHDTVLDDFRQIAEILGVRFKTRTIALMGGGVRRQPCIWFSGFYSQNDGACFEGRYEYAKSASTAIRAHAPRDRELHRIADALQAMQRRNFYQLYADIGHRGRHYDQSSMQIAVRRDSWRDLTSDAEDAVDDALRDLAHWLYRQLEREYEYLNSDEMVDAAIRANLYTFTEDGGRFG